ncbi:MAG: DNA mismatch repair endonuclease MutL, partial [Clostridia bacterium]|nr:DNA mismatch repair endonuclease MutL [Clostridia bacterium]
MGIINQLDFQVANLIAAGEVVDRPASAVKELVENSIDAGASEIIVEIKHGGITFIRVTDNGCGIAREDLPVALKRHATSKISKASDLDSIMTLGFRGEALAAISSVSKVRIMTKRPEDDFGTLLTSEFGKVTDVVESGGRNGTTIIVEELFSNVPARRKFLKKDATEAMAIISAVEKQALSRPDISISVISDSVQKFRTPGDGKIMSVIRAIFGKDFTSKLAEVRSMTEGIEVNGYIGLPENVRPNRNFQIFFINGRYIRSKTVCAALEQAFDSYLESSKFPCGILYIYIHPAFVDVNVHPTKLEVKFSNDRSIFDAVYCAVKNALLNHRMDPDIDIQLQPKHVTPEKYDAVNAFVPIYDRIASEGKPKTEQKSIFENLGSEVFEKEKQEIKDYTPETSETSVNEKLPEKELGNLLEISFGATSDFSNFGNTYIDFVDIEKTAPKESEPAGEKDETAPTQEKFLFSLSDMTAEQVTKKDIEKPYRILGTAFHAYIFVELDGKIMVVDKHAAHERILFEDMRRILKSSESHSQLLIVPESVSLGSEEFAAVIEYSDDIKAFGF